MINFPMTLHFHSSLAIKPDQTQKNDLRYVQLNILDFFKHFTANALRYDLHPYQHEQLLGLLNFSSTSLNNFVSSKNDQFLF